MNYDLSDLFDRVPPSQIDTYLKQCTRLTNSFDQQQAYSILELAIASESLTYLADMNQQQIRNNFLPEKNFKAKEKTTGKMDIEYHPSEKQQVKKRQRYQEQSIKNQHNNLGSKKIKEEINGKNENDFERIKRDAFKLLKEYRDKFTSLKESELQKIFQIIEEYLIENKMVQDRYNLSSQAQKIGKIGFSQSERTMKQYLKLVDSALYHSSDRHRLRPTQILAIILFLCRNNSRKVLLQILTGEGKSTTISCIAAILTLSGYHVDIVTTNDILAKRDVQQKHQFYKLLGISVDHNFEENQKGPKNCYTNKKIVYGTPHSFQVDVLMDQYKKKNTRCKRPYEILIVDEVDSMFVDQKDHQTLLSTTYPGFSELVHPMKLIWNKINTYPLFVEDKKYKMLLPLGKDNTAKGEAKEIMQQVIKDIRIKFKNEVIPQWRMQFIQISLENWIRSAITAAFQYKEKQHYLVRNGNIVPIDFKNTGCLQEKVHWDNGLHQFLQIKHGLQVSTEGMTSNFISNLGHFDKYSQIYGLTGTLGSKESKQFLKETYKAELMEVPPFKQRRLMIEQGVIGYNETDWAKLIAQKIQMMCLCERAVLLLCETIQEIDLIEIALKQSSRMKFNVKFLRTGDEKLSDRIDSEEVIVATNLAGRGTDLKISQRLNERGGLHVIIGFMPNNLRVEMQGRGRAGRNGCHGSSQLIINYEKYMLGLGQHIEPPSLFEHLNELKQMLFYQNIRDQIQEMGMMDDIEKVKILRCKDKIFSMYCNGVNQIPDFQTNHAKQLAIEERWAMFLKTIETNKISYELIEDEAQVLINNLVKNSQSFYNPNHFVNRGVDKLIEGNKKEAIQMFKDSQKNNAGSLTQIAGGLYQNVCSINEDPKNNEVKMNGLRGLMKVKGTIEERKHVLKGLNVYNLENKAIVQHHQDSVQNLERLFERNIRIEQPMGMQMQPIVNERMPELNPQSSNIQMPVHQSIELEDGESRVLSAISNHIDSIKEKFQKLGKNQYIEFNYEPIKEILKEVSGNQKQNQEALAKLQTEGLHFLPKPEVKKIKVKWWKRLLVFALGVLQIVCGAIILASTGGALTGFGVHMMMEGAKDCYNAIFRPEVIDDLKKYFGQKAMGYTFALAVAGLEGINQLAQLSKNGFTMFKNTPFKAACQNMFSNVIEGAKKFPTSLFSNKGMGAVISQGLSSKLMNKNKNMRDMVQNPVQVIQQNASRIKKEVDEVSKVENLQEYNVQQIVNNFEQKISIEIHQIVSRMEQQILAELKNLPLSEQEVYVIVTESIRQSIKFDEKTEEYKKLLQLITPNIHKSQLPNLYVKHIRLEKIIQEAFKNIKNNKNYQTSIENAMSKLICNSYKQVYERVKGEIDRKKDAHNRKHKRLSEGQNTMVVSAYNAEVESFNAESKALDQEVNKLNEFVNYLQANESNLLSLLKTNNCFDRNGRVNPAAVNRLPIPQLLKQSLSNIKYEDGSQNFMKALESSVYNSTATYAIKIITMILEDTQGIAQKVQSIAQRLMK